jgi:hypothetical protein
MHTFGETGVPAFLAKLWRLVEDEETNDLIGWSSVSDIRNKKYGNQKKCVKKMMKFSNLTKFGCTQQTIGLSSGLAAQAQFDGYKMTKFDRLCLEFFGIESGNHLIFPSLF